MEKWALLSVYNKDGISDFARGIVAVGWKLFASGGTRKLLYGAGLQVRDVAELVGGGEMLKHRVVTLSREVHAGLLADTNDPEQMAEMEALHLPIIDMLVCDFYPLAEAMQKPTSIAKVVEMTDIGGPTMVRSAAKGGRIVICRPQDRRPVLNELQLIGDVCPANRQKLRARAEFEVANYCLMSAIFHSEGRFHGVLSETPPNRYA
jgi:phosphoribosylaminoimidazolecarboxamide formyltransferase/IMP cyclohydrolase